jgi:hypothetical protein
MTEWRVVVNGVNISQVAAVAYPGILFGVGGGRDSTNSVEDRENGDVESVAP